MAAAVNRPTGLLDSVVRVRPLSGLALSLLYYSLKVRNLLGVVEEPVSEFSDVFGIQGFGFAHEGA
jgi:hypothetical protein